MYQSWLQPVIQRSRSTTTGDEAGATSLREAGCSSGKRRCRSVRRVFGEIRAARRAMLCGDGSGETTRRSTPASRAAATDALEPSAARAAWCSNRAL